MSVHIGDYDHLNEDEVKLPIKMTDLFDTIMNSNYGTLRYLHHVIKAGAKEDAPLHIQEAAAKLYELCKDGFY